MSDTLFLILIITLIILAAIIFSYTTGAILARRFDWWCKKDKYIKQINNIIATSKIADIIDENNRICLICGEKFNMIRDIGCRSELLLITDKEREWVIKECKKENPNSKFSYNYFFCSDCICENDDYKRFSKEILREYYYRT